MRHRGAVAADRRTGDGAGCCCRSRARSCRGRGAGSRWSSSGTREARGGDRGRLRARGYRAARLAARPGRAEALGDAARASAPAIEQLVLLRAARARRRRGGARPTGHASAPSAPRARYVGSLSFRTVTYKALCAADQLAAFYPGPARPDARGAVRDLPPAVLDQHDAVVGARAALPAALPQRRDQHDRRATSTGCGRARAARRRTTSARARVDETGSDSAMLDNALELLVRGGRDVRHAARC